MGTTKSRRENVEWMKQICRKVQEEGKEIDKKKLFAQFAYQRNSTEQKGREIFEMLLKAGEI